MKRIFVIGAGLSSSSLIKYLLDNSFEHNWEVTVGDMSEELAKRKIDGHSKGKAIAFDIFNDAQKEEEIAKADVVISMLPARMHYLVANTCLRFSKNMITASYVGKEIKEMSEAVEKAGLLFLNEIGVDPGIDHMSAMEVINRIKEQGGKLTAFCSNTGGLVAPRYDNNPWNYKFTWNPRNVILAGQGTSKLIMHGKYKYIPYSQLFKRTTRANVLNYGEFEVYPNRDSLSYRSVYNLEDIPTMIRGTMRRPGFCRTWDTFVQLGATDDSYTIENSENMTYREFINIFLKYETDTPVETKLARFMNFDENGSEMYKLRWLGIFENKKIGMKNATPAQILQQLCEQKWEFTKEDRDMIVMQHQFDYELNGKAKRLLSSLVVEGKDHIHTAMSITVGIPVAIATKLLLTGKITATGVQIPTRKDIYESVLRELENYGIKFIEEEVEI